MNFYSFSRRCSTALISHGLLFISCHWPCESLSLCFQVRCDVASNSSSAPPIRQLDEMLRVGPGCLDFGSVRHGWLVEVLGLRHVLTRRSNIRTIAGRSMIAKVIKFSHIVTRKIIKYLDLYILLL